MEFQNLWDNKEYIRTIVTNFNTCKPQYSGSTHDY